MDHTAALGDTAHADGLSANGGLHRNFLTHRVGGHDGVSRSVRAFGAVSKALHELRHRILNDLHRQGLADDPRGGNQYVIRRNAQRLCHGGALRLGVFLALGRAGVGIAAVGDDRPGLAVGQMGFVDVDGGRLDHVLCKYRRRRAIHVGNDQSHVLFPCRVGLDAHVKSGCLKALCGADAAVNKFHCIPSLI
ncbi:hypothetical protein SDC9_164169 [bioreactor metagenome]|uniref:Uncharacterized protein n=1 Tax=bioreactor metagenome TaxID=1076179 RepID=A0A645FT50_9ZZZZ